MIFCLVLVTLMVAEAAPAKGGSKSMMKNRWVLWKRSLAISSAAILQIAGAVLKDQDHEAADGATTPLATTVTVGLAGGGSGRTSPPVLASATTTSYMASRKSQQPQGSQFHGVTNCTYNQLYILNIGLALAGNLASASVTSTSCASPKGCLGSSGGGAEEKPNILDLSTVFIGT